MNSFISWLWWYLDYMIGYVCHIHRTVHLKRVNFSGCKLYLHEWENKINYVTHVQLLVHDSYPTNVISCPHPVFYCFLWKPLTIWGILSVGNQSTLHITQILVEHILHHTMCVYIHVPPGLWAPWMQEAVPHSPPTSLLSGTLVCTQ